MRRSRFGGLLAAVLVTVAAAACSDDPISNDLSPIAGLQESAVRDSTGSAPPPDPGTGPGIVRGTVLGESEPGAGNDSLETAPRIAGVRVTAYPVIGTQTGGGPELGPEAASTTTGADGKFELPPLAGGEYAVVFDPPATSGYRGQWAHGPVGPQSADFPWWVVLNED
jgi:hypothetical protein